MYNIIYYILSCLVSLLCIESMDEMVAKNKNKQFVYDVRAADLAIELRVCIENVW